MNTFVSSKRDDFHKILLTSSCNTLREELLKHGDLYDAFIASINSAIDDMIRNKCDSKTEPAEFILQRLIGEDEL